MANDRRDELDQILDRGLAAWSDAEPLAGLEDRVLNRVRLADRGRRARPWRWVAVPVAALAAFAIVTAVSRQGMSKHGRTPSPPVAAESARAVEPRVPAATAPPAAAVPVRPRPNRSRDRKGASLPKQNFFPTPTPLTPEERALVSLASLRPADAQAFAYTRERNSREINISPIEIPPLRIDGNP